MDESAQTQTRGTCQCCGKQQAKMPMGLAKHGYTVANGWFEGTCAGSGAEALEISRQKTDNMCAQVLVECNDLEARAVRWEAGKSHPTRIARTSVRRGEEKTIPWADATGHERVQGLKLAIEQARYRVRQGRAFVDVMQHLAEKRHGQPLWEVPRPVPPRTLRKGDVMVTTQGRKLVIASIERARAYFREEIDGQLSPRRSWMGLASARKLVEATEAAALATAQITPELPLSSRSAPKM